MPKYDWICDVHGKVTLSMSYAEFDTFPGFCLWVSSDPENPGACGLPMRRDYSDGIPVATFYGQDFTRRSTDERQNRNINHWDKRMNERFPGSPNMTKHGREDI